MGQHDLRIITRLVAQHRHEVCCLTAGVHADAGHAATSAGIAIGDVRHVLTDIAGLCREKGWDFRALVRHVTASPGRAGEREQSPAEP